MWKSSVNIWCIFLKKLKIRVLDCGPISCVMYEGSGSSQVRCYRDISLKLLKQTKYSDTQNIEHAESFSLQGQTWIVIQAIKTPSIPGCTHSNQTSSVSLLIPLWSHSLTICFQPQNSLCWLSIRTTLAHGNPSGAAVSEMVAIPHLAQTIIPHSQALRSCSLHCVQSDRWSLVCRLACLLSGNQSEEPEAAGNGSTLGMKRVITKEGA